MIIEAYQGETVKIETSVVDTSGNAANLTGAIAKFALLQPSGDKITKDCSISENVVQITLSPEETADVGFYRFEIRIKLNDEVDSLVIGDMQIRESLITSIESE